MYSYRTVNTAYRTEYLDIDDDEEREFIRPAKSQNYSSTIILLALTTIIVIGVVVSPYLFVSLQEKNVPLTTTSTTSTTNVASVPIPIPTYPSLNDEIIDDEQEAFDAAQTDPRSYSELARESMKKIFPTVISQISAVQHFVAPSIVKPVRKAIQQINDYLEIFYAAYSPVGTHDYWQELTDSFEQGYKVIGEFQDLAASGVLYNETDAANRRDEVLRWRESYIELMGTFDVEQYLYTPDKEEAKETPSRRLSKWFWGGTEIRPILKLTGLQNIAKLLNDALKHLRGRQIDALRIPEIFSEKNHEEFHGFRKRCRTVINLLHYFPTVLATNSKEVTASVDLISSIYDQYGALNDHWNAWNFYDKRIPLDPDMLEHYRNLVDRSWQKLKEAQTEGGQLDVTRAVSVLERALINF